jgi:hypothetical protein
MSSQKFGKDAPFNDPVVRCDSCAVLIQRERIHKLGMCECGNRRVRNVVAMTPEEWDKVKSWDGIDPDWLALFQAVDNG